MAGPETQHVTFVHLQRLVLAGTMLAGYSDVAERLAALTDSHAPDSASPPKLLDRVRTAVRVRHYSRLQGRTRDRDRGDSARGARAYP
jgi:hypothetical protein